ncbi:hypothetical protein [Syntrophorhabdus aromaticivorans]|uniref:hypothetical protein n=1 Tax=Syntrophorhabdus aromaticivorans TaxID=328301 RepID=UPI00042347BA|nr:hypothetical protein [Syntrophorhabdus aromaticivorans]NLX25187.1 hypothetical protein [Lentisphaerota bacterium]
MTENLPAPGESQIVIYQAESGMTRLEVRLQDETVWLTQNLMAELYQTTKQNKMHHAAESDGICTGELLVLRPRAAAQRFLLDYVLNPDFIAVVDSSTYGAKMPRANWDYIGNLPALIPPSEEQRSIVAFLDRETAWIDALVGKVEKSIELLRGYRIALISAAVTGKIDVRKEVLAG